jgi:adenosylmethionine-8-amino-7-oxononanoate aminotransferase
VKGKGIYLYDADGRRYLDAIASWWACSLGHGHPRLVAAIRRQAGELQHSILGNLAHPRAVELAAMLAALFPDDRRVCFASDGASAVEAALKIALQYWHNRGRGERCRFAALDFAYHGDTLGAVSVGYLEPFHRPFKPALFPAYQAESPCCGTCARGLVPGACGLECFDSMRLILREYGRELAAVIVEPLCQCAGYLRELARHCAEREVLLIADEIATGFGRTGRLFAFEHAGIRPDIVCVGKALSGGTLPLSATIVRAPIYDTFTDRPADHTFYHGHTFAGNPIACAAAVEALRVYREERIVERAASLGKVLADELAPLGRIPGVRNVRSLGLIGVVQLGAGAGGADGAERAARVRNLLMAEGILIRPLGGVVYLMPPLVIGERELRALVRTLGRAVAAAG